VHAGCQRLARLYDQPWMSPCRFIANRDFVTLQSMKFESPESAGFRDMEAGDYRNLPRWVYRAGPRKKIYYDPHTVTAAIVTCGGLCPGLNDVIQHIVLTLLDYGVPEEQILGIRYGLKGFYAQDKKPVTMSRRYVDGIHLKGGTILGTSRGGADIKRIVHRIDLWGLARPCCCWRLVAACMLQQCSS
jgi:6-phosphofructokinase 1